jgi:hypothetical protein
MDVRSLAVLTAAAGLVVASPAAAGPRTLEGEVVAVSSHWSADGRTILSEVTIRGLDGAVERYTQLGGSVDGIGMRVTHMPSVPTVGDAVIATVSERVTPTGTRGLVLDAATTATPLYVSTRTKKAGVPVTWRSGCAFVAYNEVGSSQVAGEREFAIMDEVLAAWNDGGAGCSYFRLESDGKTAAKAIYDGLNVVQFRTDEWCRQEANGAEMRPCYNPDAAALTTLFFVDDPDRDNDGEIFDADIELNAIDFAFADSGQTEGGPGCIADLAGTMTHEVGHLLGFDHNCWNPNDTDSPRPVDDTGAPVPSCFPASALPESITEATMYWQQTCGETKKATLEADDIAALCGTYALADDPGTCEPVDLPGAGCCAVAGSSPTSAGERHGALGLALCAALVLVRLRRR